MAEQRPETRVQAPQVRGCVLTPRLAYVAKRWGEDEKELVLAKLSSADRRRLEGVAADGDWFDISVFETIERTIVDEIAEGDPSVPVVLGRACADYNVKRILAVRTAGLGVDLVLQRYCKVPLLENFGEGEYEDVPIDEGSGAAITYPYQASVSERYLTSAIGFFERLIERLGGSNVKVSRHPVPELSPYAQRFEISWERGAELDDEAHAPSSAITTEEVSRSPERVAPRPPVEKPLDALGEMFKDAVAAKAPQSPPKPVAFTAEKKSFVPKALRNPKLLAVVAIAVFGLVIFEYAWATGMLAPAHRGYLGGHMFTRTGDLEVVVALDKRTLLLEAGEHLADVKVTIELGPSSFSTTYPVLPKSALVQADLSEFRGTDGATPPTSESMTKVVVEAMVDGVNKVGEFRP
jgi:hypothetical protein